MAGPCVNDTDSIILSVTDDDSLEADLAKSPDAYNGLDVRANGVWTPARPPIVTALPSGVDDGTEIIYKVSDSCFWGMIWSDDEGRWVCAGGQMPFHARRNTLETRSSPTLGTLNGPSLALPGDIGGDFMLGFGGWISNSTTGVATGVGAYISPKFSAAAADEDNGIRNSLDALIACAGEVYLTGVPAGQIIDLRYRSANTDAASFSHRYMSLRPLLIDGV